MQRHRGGAGARTVLRVALIALCLLVSLSGGRAQVDERALVSVDAETSAGGATIRMRWAAQVEVEQVRDAFGLLLRFSAPLDADPLAELPEKLTGWLLDLRYGYDSMLLVPVANVRVTARVEDRVVTIRFEPQASAPAQQTQDEPAGDRLAPAGGRPSLAAASPARPLPSAQAKPRVTLAEAVEPDDAASSVAVAAPDFGQSRTDAEQDLAGVQAPDRAPDGGQAPEEEDALADFDDVSPEREAEGDGSSPRLARLRAVLRAERGDLVGGIAEMRALAARHPGQLEMYVSLAELESRLGRWRRAIAAYDRALTLSPDSQRMIENKARLIRSHGPQLRMSSDFASVKDQDDQLSIIFGGRLPLADHWTFDLMVERREVDSPPFTRANGERAAFEGARHRGRLSLAADIFGIGRVRGSILAGPDGPGVGLRLERAGNAGLSQLDVNWREPYFDLVGAIADGGTRSGVRLQHRKLVGEQIELLGALGLHDYSIDGISGVARSVEAKLSLGYVHARGDTTISSSYRFEVENVLDRDERVDRNGFRYRPLPLESSEAHTIELRLEEQLTDYLRAGGHVGYTYDRLGSSGPVADLELLYEPHPAMTLGLHAGTAITSSRGSDAQTLRVGGFLNLRL